MVPVNPEDVAHVLALLATQHPVGEELQQEFHTHAFAVELNEGQHLVYKGDLCNYMYFIRKGALMGYTSHNGKEITTYISIENEFVSSLSGLYGEQPSRESIMAVEPSLVLGVSTDTLQGWYRRFFDLNFIIRQVYEHYYRDAQERSHVIRIGNARERYLYFVNTRPGYIERLPLKYVASFLDMKPETLLRIKKREQTQRQHSELSTLVQRIDAYMQETACFKEKSLKVHSLAERLGVANHILSQALNAHYQKSFTDFINQHRVTYIKTKLSDATFLQNYTMEALALEAGFASRSGFYKAFKKLEGISPKSYLALS